MTPIALLEVRVAPWRPRARVMKADTLREAADPLTTVDDLTGVLVGLALWLVVVVAAPLTVLVLAAALLTIELPIVLALALLLLVARFAGLIPWTVVILDNGSAFEHRESYRSLWKATARIRSINNDRHVRVRWAWS